jgi:dienelactone hydrolase
MIQDLEYATAHRRFAGFAAVPDAAAGSGVLLLHGGGGLGDHERERARRLAELGHVVYAPDLFGAPFTDRAHGMAVIGALVADPGELRSRLAAAWQRLTALPGVDAARTAAVGHCFGGLAALELARSGAALRATVAIHGGLAARQPAPPGAIRARVLAVAGAGDPFCPAEQRAAFEAEMTAAGADWQLLVLGGARHGFSVPGIDPAKHPGCAYDAASDRRAWQAMCALFDEALGASADQR